MAHAKRNIETLPEAEPREAAGVVYTAVAGLRMFRCEPYAANLTQKGCGARWREAQTAAGEAADRVSACRGCAIGAMHAGYEPISYSTWFGVSICPRCDKGTTRMIGGRRCVSCYNRQRELKSGKNARGNVPVELQARPLRPVYLTLVVDNEPRLHRDRESTGVPETVKHLMRTSKGELGFGYAGPAHLLRQRRLF